MSENAKKSTIGGYHAKAGMKNVDFDSINSVIEEMSKGSSFGKNETRKKEVLKKRIDNILGKLKTLKKNDPLFVEKVDKRVVELEGLRDLSQTYVHVDMDAFFVSVELKYRPELRGKPVAVGGDAMLSASSYEARRYGVRSAMPGFIAKRLCPDLIIVGGSFSRYAEESAKCRDILEEYDPHLSSYSLDEASLNLTEYLRRTSENVVSAVSNLRKRVFDKTELTLSAGIAPTRPLAKVCSELNKPNGQYLLENNRDSVMDFVRSLPCRKIPGIGKVSEALLQSLGIISCEDLFHKRYELSQLFPPISSEFFLQVSMGLDIPTPRSEGKTKKVRQSSISAERTFGRSSSHRQFLSVLENIAASLARRLQTRSEKQASLESETEVDNGVINMIKAKQITLKLKTAEFRVISRSVLLRNAICEEKDLLSVSTQLLNDYIENEMSGKALCLRLLGVKLSDFDDGRTSTEVSVPSSQKRIADFIQQVESDSDDDDDDENSCGEGMGGRENEEDRQKRRTLPLPSTSLSTQTADNSSRRKKTKMIMNRIDQFAMFFKYSTSDDDDD